MDLNQIPKIQTDNFSEGVSEVECDTLKEMQAFLKGLNYADDVDVEHGDIFIRNNKVVVRVKVGNFYEF